MLTNHFMAVYSDFRMKERLLFKPVKVTLDNDGAVLYVTSEMTPSKLEDAFDRYGVDVDRTKDRLMIRSFEEFYMNRGRCSLEATWSHLNEAVKHALKFKAFLSVGEVAGFYKYNALDVMLQSERRAEATQVKKPTSIPITGLCGYSLDMLLKSEPYLYTKTSELHETVLGLNLNRFPVTVDVDLERLRRLMTRFPWLGDSAERFVSESVTRRMEDLLQTAGSSQPSPLSKTRQTVDDSHK